MNGEDRGARLFAAAEAGDVAGLLDLAYSDSVEEPEGVAYKWLNVASDFGHDEADEMIDAMLQGPLHADDGNYVSGHAHFELAVAYLTGRDGLPVDFDKARTHLRKMLDRDYPYTVQDGKETLVEARNAMSPQARVVFDAVLPRDETDPATVGGPDQREVPAGHGRQRVDLEQMTRSVVLGGTEYTFLRPGVTLCMLYAQPARTLAPVVADILQDYLDFVPDGALQTYLSASGTWRKATGRTITTTLRELRGIDPEHYFEFHFGQEPPRNVGQFGAHFAASPPNWAGQPTDSGSLYLEFPTDLETFTSIEDFVDFVRKVALRCEFDSGFCGYAFKHLHMSLRGEAFEEIDKMAMRYLGFDLSNGDIRRGPAGQIYNVSWLTLLGPQITARLGGLTRLRSELPDVTDIQQVGPAVMIRASEAPILGDVDQGAPDVAPLRKLALLTRPLRADLPNLGPDDPDFAARWLARLDP
ncbi:type VI immunity family protein [Virgisporangium aurantiacum]|uniref:Uncharacterized protein n=1 Tax=Virgisporangium aurantiacum TaxID=175570 RepID=A0A8J3ZJK4_9ACTN|nr:type VI immunity family protein [Virgisporangium aurantiacum]GIJ64951.1 hypothetical protein Vau01_124670 [Virgisporangium aurantiacum]